MLCNTVLATLILMCSSFALPAATARADDREPPKTWQEAVKVIRSGGEVHSESTGDGGDKSDIYMAYEVFRDHAPIAEVLTLADDPSPSVCAYSVLVLAQRHRDADVAGIVFELAPRRDTLMTVDGCCGDERPLGDYVVEEVLYRLPDDVRKPLVRRLVFEGPKTPARASLLEGFEFDRGDLPALRKLADVSDVSALPALARFREADDVARITAVLARKVDPAGDFLVACQAAERHGDGRLLEPLAARASDVRDHVGSEDGGWFDAWVAALGMHDSKPVADALVTYLDARVEGAGGRRAMGRNAAKVVHDRTSVVYDPVRFRIWKTSGLVDADTLRLLYARDSKRVLETAGRELATYRAEYEQPYAPLLDWLHAEDAAAAERALVGLLPALTSHHAIELCARVARWRPEAAVPLLLSTYERTDDNLLFQPICRALLCFDRPEIDADLARYAAKKHDTFGWLKKYLEEKQRTWERD